jgi:hypothetical protein
MGGEMERLALLILYLSRLGYEIIDLEKANDEIDRPDGIIEIRRR